MTTFELGTLNSATGAEEESDSIVRTDTGIEVTPGLTYKLTHDSEGINEAIFWYESGGDFISRTLGDSGTAPAQAATARIIIDTSGVTEFEWSFELSFGFTSSMTLGGNPADFTWFMGDGTVKHGFSVQHNYSSSIVKKVEVRAKVKDWTNISELDLMDADIVGTLNIENLNVFDQLVMKLTGNPLLTQIKWGVVSGQLLQFLASGAQLSGVDLLPLGSAVDVGNCLIDLTDNDINSENVDRILSELDIISGSGYSDRQLLIAGNNQAPTAAGLASISSLEEKGWTITVSE